MNVVNLDQLAYKIGQFCRTFGRIHVTDTKEKYGTIRVYCTFGFLGFHTLLWPGRAYKHKYCPRWVWNLDVKLYGSKIEQFINLLLVPYQKLIYKTAYKLALRTYPHLNKEITRCMDYPEYL